MADVKIADLPDGVTLESTDRFPAARSPYAPGDNVYVDGAEFTAAILAGIDVPIIYSATPPAGPTAPSEPYWWWDTTNGVMYAWIDDAGGGQWVLNAPGVGPIGPTGPTGPTGPSVPSDFQPAIVTGNYYYPKYMSFASTVAYYGDVLSAVPIWFSHTETWTRIGLHVATADAGKSVRFGLYANGADNLPGALIADLGTISLTATGYIELTISQSLTANTVYWIAAVANTDGAAPVAEVDLWYYAASGGSTIFSTFGGIIGYPQPLDPSAASLVTVPVVRAFTYAAMPNPWGTPDGDFTPDQSAPAIWLRKV